MIFVHKAYLSDAEIKRLFDDLDRQGMRHRVFYADQQKDADAFMAYVRKDCWFLHIVDGDGTSLGAAWLDEFSGETAFMHYWINRCAWRRSDEIGQATLDYMARHLDGRIGGLIGRTPKSNTLACRYLERQGFQVMCTIPKAVTLWNGKHDDVVVSYYPLKDRQNESNHEDRN